MQSIQVTNVTSICTGITHVSDRGWQLCQAETSTCSLLLVMVCSAVFIQAGQIQSFLCEHAGTKQMGGKQCHYSMQASCLNAKKPKRHTNIGLLGRCRSQKRMVVGQTNRQPAPISSPHGDYHRYQRLEKRLLACTA